MKLTKQHLKTIIQEELEAMLRSQNSAQVSRVRENRYHNLVQEEFKAMLNEQIPRIDRNERDARQQAIWDEIEAVRAQAPSELQVRELPADDPDASEILRHNLRAALEAEGYPPEEAMAMQPAFPARRNRN